MVEHAKNHIFSKRSDLWFPEAESGENRDWRKVVKVYKLLVIREISTRDVMHHMMTIVNFAV